VIFVWPLILKGHIRSTDLPSSPARFTNPSYVGIVLRHGIQPSVICEPLQIVQYRIMGHKPGLRVKQVSVARVIERRNKMCSSRNTVCSGYSNMSNFIRAVLTLVIKD
jgi:hypothetical protein